MQEFFSTLFGGFPGEVWVHGFPRGIWAQDFLPSSSFTEVGCFWTEFISPSFIYHRHFTRSPILWSDEKTIAACDFQLPPGAISIRISIQFIVTSPESVENAITRIVGFIEKKIVYSVGSPLHCWQRDESNLCKRIKSSQPNFWLPLKPCCKFWFARRAFWPALLFFLFFFVDTHQLEKHIRWGQQRSVAQCPHFLFFRRTSAGPFCFSFEQNLKF